MLLMDALSRAGGITARGSLRSIQIKRAKETICIDMYDLLTQGDIDMQKYLLRAGDVLAVPYKTRVVSIQGKIRNPVIHELRPGEALADLIEMAGQLDADADRQRLQIRRISSAQDGYGGRVSRERRCQQLPGASPKQDDSLPPQILKVLSSTVHPVIACAGSTGATG